jgi:imidazolonepropionase-like amidohydrolase
VLAIINAELHAISRGVVKGGTVLIEGGKIVAAGAGIEVPAGSEIIDASGKVVTPGIIDAHTHLGISEEGIGFEGADYNEKSDPVTPELRAIDGINPEEMGLRDALTGGITAATIAPGSANVLGGQMVAVKTHGQVVDSMVLRQPCGMKAAFGENPKRVYNEQKKSPITRMGTAGLLRKALVEAGNYRDRQRRAAEEGKSEPRDLKNEVMVRVLNREFPLRAHAHRADDIMTAIRIAEEFQVDLVLEHATEAHKIAGELAKRNLPAVVGPSLTSRSKYELRERTFATPRVLHEAGVKFALMTDHPVIPAQYLPLCAAMAVREGLPVDVALRAITLNAAEIMGVADRLGSLDPGKDADLVIWSDHPLEAKAVAEKVFVDGQLVYARP